MSLQAIQSVFYRRSVRSPTALSAGANGESRDQLTRQKIEKEFLDTERAYVARLEVLVEVFMMPLQAWVREICEDEAMAQQHPYFEQQTCRRLFSNIEEILRVNKYILNELEVAANQSHEALAQVFVTTGPFLQQYLLYYTNYNQASELLNHLMTVSKDFRLFLKACEFQPRCKGEKLPSLLIQPVQRLPRYRLLLETLLKHTPAGSTEHKLLEQAIEKVGQVLNKLNGEIAKKQEREQMQVLASRFENEVHMIAPHRLLIKEGPLLKISLTWGARQERYVVLMNDMMIYGKKQFTADKFSSSHELALLQAVLLASDAEGEAFFILLTPQKSIYFIAPSVEEKDSWVEHFRQAFQSINRAEQGRYLDLIMEPNGQASLSTTSPLERRWVRRKIPLTNVSEDGAVSRREYIVPDHIMNSVRGIFPFSDVLPLQQKPFSRSPVLSMRNSVMGARKPSSVNLGRTEQQVTPERRIAQSMPVRRGTVPGAAVTSPPSSAQRSLEMDLDMTTPPKEDPMPDSDLSFVSPSKSSVHSSPMSSIAPTPDMLTPTKPQRGSSEAGTPVRLARADSDIHSPTRSHRSASEVGTPTRSNRGLSDAPTPTRINRATLAPLVAAPMNPLYQHPTPVGDHVPPSPLYSTQEGDDASGNASIVSAAFNFLGGLFFTPATVRPRPSELHAYDFSSPPDSEFSEPSSPTYSASDREDNRESMNGRSSLAPPPAHLATTSMPPPKPPRRPSRRSLPARLSETERSSDFS